MDFDFALKILCLLLITAYSVGFIYYLYILRKLRAECNSDKKDDIPCPSTCNPGYECTQTDPPSNFIIGDLVEESVFEELVPELVPQVAEKIEVAEKADTEVPEKLGAEADTIHLDV